MGRQGRKRRCLLDYEGEVPIDNRYRRRFHNDNVLDRPVAAKGRGDDQGNVAVGVHVAVEPVDLQPVQVGEALNLRDECLAIAGRIGDGETCYDQ